MEQEISRERLGVDLIQAAKNQLDFLALVDEHPRLYYSGPVLRNAIRRYEICWLPLISVYQRTAEQPKILAAPLDIAWVWHVHMLAPYQYEQDCDTIGHGLVDHCSLTPEQRLDSLEIAKSLWEIWFGSEPFEINVDEDPSLVKTYSSKIRYNLEEACQRQAKFYYQVSLPHYRDNRFLNDAVDRYITHLRLKKKNPGVFMVPCYDFDLIWHAHQLHPVNYKQTTTKWLGRMLNHDDSVTDRTPGSKLSDSAIKTWAIWFFERSSFDKAGAMYRGDPPEPRVPTQPRLPRDRLENPEYQVLITKVERKPDLIQITGQGKVFRMKVFSQVLTKTPKYSKPFIVNKDTNGMLEIAIYEKLFFGKKLLANGNVNILDGLSDEVPVGNRKLYNPFVTRCVDMSRGKYRVTLYIQKDVPKFQTKMFTLAPGKFCEGFDHPRKVLSCPQLMLSPGDIAKPIMPCESSTHNLFASGMHEQSFKCRVLHSQNGRKHPLSAVEIVNREGVVVASSHTITSTLPRHSAIEDKENCVFVNEHENEKAMLVRGPLKDYGVCIGKWASVQLDNGEQREVEDLKFKFFKLKGLQGWCTVRKFKQYRYHIDVTSLHSVSVDLEKGKISISSCALDIPEILALGLSVSMIYLLCDPHRNAGRSSTLISNTKIALLGTASDFHPEPTNERERRRGVVPARAPGSDARFANIKRSSYGAGIMFSFPFATAARIGGPSNNDGGDGNDGDGDCGGDGDDGDGDGDDGGGDGGCGGCDGGCGGCGD